MEIFVALDNGGKVSVSRILFPITEQYCSILRIRNYLYCGNVNFIQILKYSVANCFFS